MANVNFDPQYSSNKIWRDEDMERCLTDDLDAIESDIATLETGKANINHNHSGYATVAHTHTEYASTTSVSALQNLVGDTSVSAQISTAISGKVDKVDGKELSSNDYTSTEKNKLSGIESGAQKNTITGVKGDAESTYRTGNINLTLENIGAAASSHNHAASNITSGTLNSDRLPTVPISKGGTGATTVEGVLSNLGDIGRSYINNASNLSVSRLTWTNLATVTLPAGTYVVIANHIWGLSSAGTIYVDRIRDASNTYCTNRSFMNGGGGTTTAAIVVLTASTTIIYDTYHEHTAAATAGGIHLSAVKIK